MLVLTMLAGCEKNSNDKNLQTQIVYITETGHKYHRENCRYLKSSKIPIELYKAKEEGYTPCLVCKPPS